MQKKKKLTRSEKIECKKVIRNKLNMLGESAKLVEPKPDD